MLLHLARHVFWLAVHPTQTYYLRPLPNQAKSFTAEMVDLDRCWFKCLHSCHASATLSSLTLSDLLGAADS